MDPAQQANENEEEETVITYDLEDSEMDLDDLVQTPTVDTDQVIASVFSTSSTAATSSSPADDPKDTPSKVSIPREDALHLHGTDDMNTEDVLGYFSEFGPLSVEWINDTSCNITFPTPATAQSALSALLVDPTASPSHTLLRKSVAYNVPSTSSLAQNLHLRIATDWDVKEKGAYHRSRYYLFHQKEPSAAASARRERKPYSRSTGAGSRRGAEFEPEAERVEGVPEAYYEDLAEEARGERGGKGDVMSRLGEPVARKGTDVTSRLGGKLGEENGKGGTGILARLGKRKEEELQVPERFKGRLGRKEA